MRYRRLLKALAVLSFFGCFAGVLSGCAEKFSPISPDLEDGKYAINKNNVRFLGRYYEDTENGDVKFSWSNAGFEFRFYGTEAKAVLTLNSSEKDIKAGQGTVFVSVYVDGKQDALDASVIKLEKKEAEYVLATGLEEGYHTITVRKRDRGYNSGGGGLAFGAKEISVSSGKEAKSDADPYGKLVTVPEAKSFKIEAIGDSITTGDGIYDKDKYQGLQSDGWSTYAAEAARLLDADLSTVAISGNGLISSLFGDHLLDLPTQWPYYDPQIWRKKEWDFEKYQADIVVINLGTNDRAGVGPGKKFTYEEFEEEYVRFAGEIKSKYPGCKIIACLGAMGLELKPQIENAVKQVNQNADEEFMYTEWFIPDKEKDGESADKSHPSLAAHRRYGKQLAERISGLTGRKIVKSK